MNRVIKFRAWNINKHIMADVSQLHWNGSVHVSYKQGEEKQCHFFGGNYVGDDWGKDDCVIMQFTGLHDKNGKEIYEGDIVALDRGGTRWNLSALEVIFLNGSFQFNRKELPYPCGFVTYAEQCSTRGLLDSHSKLGGIITVVGNIHENPELLNTIDNVL